VLAVALVLQQPARVRVALVVPVLVVPPEVLVVPLEVLVPEQITTPALRLPQVQVQVLLLAVQLQGVTSRSVRLSSLAFIFPSD
jgi:hypothetical protein